MSCLETMPAIDEIVTKSGKIYRTNVDGINCFSTNNETGWIEIWGDGEDNLIFQINLLYIESIGYDENS